MSLYASLAVRRVVDACFSAKYFWGPNGGGFVAGRRAGGVVLRTAWRVPP